MRFHNILDNLEGPAAKKQKLDDSDADIGNSQSACFLLTKVTGIPSKYNKNTLSISIKGIHLLF